MKKSFLAAAAILGAAVLAGEAQAAKISLGDGKSFKMGFRGQITATIQAKRYDGVGTNPSDKSDLIFGHRFARIYAKGAISKVFKWGFQTEFATNAGTKPFEIIDSFVLLDIAKEFKVMAGSYKLPFELHSGIQSGWSFLMPSGTTYGKVKLYGAPGAPTIKHVFTNPASSNETIFRSGSRSAGLTFWGNVAGGMLKYYLGAFDTGDETNADGSSKTGIAIRLQFTPTMLGFKPETGYVNKETYAGKKDTLQVGLSFFTQDYKDVTGGTAYDTANSWGLDVLWEQNLGTVTPNFSIGYVDHKNFKGVKNDDRKGYLVQGGIMLNQVIGFGKPAVVARWIQSKCDGSACTLGTQKPELTTFGVGINYYIKGPTNRIGLAVERVKISNVPASALTDGTTKTAKDSYTDIQLALFYNF